MSWFNDLRSALHLARAFEDTVQRVAEIERHLLALESDWTDVLEKLRAREERLRIRMKREVLANVQADGAAPQDQAPAATPGTTKKALMARWRERKEG